MLGAWETRLPLSILRLMLYLLLVMSPIYGDVHHSCSKHEMLSHRYTCPSLFLSNVYCTCFDVLESLPIY